MGCSQSKIENEETVTRCKERKQFMKDAVSARNAFAAAHSAYVMALKNTGAALSDYAHGEVQYPSSSSSSTVPGGPVSLPQPPVDPFPPPPPPLPSFPPSPLQQSAIEPEMSFPKPDLKYPNPIMEEENEDEEMENESTHGGLKHRSSKSSGGGRSRIGRAEVVDHEELRKPPSPPTPAQTPPPPVGSMQSNRSPPPPPPPENKVMTSWDYFFPSMENMPGPTPAEVDEGRLEREEFERKVLEERAQKSSITITMNIINPIMSMGFDDSLQYI